LGCSNLALPTPLGRGFVTEESERLAKQAMFDVA
jgi:hypothetical protein